MENTEQQNIITIEKIRLDKNSTLIIDIVDREHNQINRIHRIEIIKPEISLGSIQNPQNTNITAFEWIDKSRTKKLFIDED